MKRPHTHQRPRHALRPPNLLLQACECSAMRRQPCITCRRWWQLFDRLMARRALWAAKGWA